MKVVNVHQRLLYATPDRVGALIDSLASPQDPLWPRGWPRMKFDRPLGVGAVGGHGPIRYFVEAYAPGQWVRFRLTGPRGFEGWHGFEVLEVTAAHSVLEHRIEMRTHGRGFFLWFLAIRPLHDVCVEEVLSRAQTALGNPPRPVVRSAYVRLLLWLAERRPAARRASPRSRHAD